MRDEVQEFGSHTEPYDRGHTKSGERPVRHVGEAHSEKLEETDDGWEILDTSVEGNLE